MKLAFIDHSFHKKTLSTKFLADILVGNGVDVEYLWDDSWQGGKPIIVDDLIGYYDSFIFFQQPAFSRDYYYKLNANITFIPMLDTFGSNEEFHHNRNYWNKFSGVKFLCFSKALHNAALSHGLASMHAQYFCDPGAFKTDTDYESINAFFWERRPDQISWNSIKALIGENKIDKLYYHTATDPGFNSTKPSKQDIEKYGIVFSKWFSDKKEYYDIISKCNIFYAPRMCEGIGMAFIEAMAMGKCVVSPDLGTMNEYITNGVNGLLYNTKNPGVLDYTNIKRVCKNARLTVEKGYAEWKSKEKDIVDFILSDRDEIYERFYNGGVDFSELACSAANGVVNEERKDTIGNCGSDSNVTRMKNFLRAHKSNPIIYPVWKVLKAVKNQGELLHKKEVVDDVKNDTGKEAKMASTSQNIVKEKPSSETGSVCNRYFILPPSQSRSLEGGLRTEGYYKRSLGDNPLVSIVTVVYNRADKVERAIESVLNQTYKNIEYIVVDGGSTDGTIEIISKYKSCIDYYVSEKDYGVYNAINKGLALATGDYIGILNSDDWFTEDAVELSIKEILKEKADYSGAEEYCLDSDGNLVGIFKLMHFDERALVAQHPCNHGTMFISRKAYEAVGYYDEKYKVGADYKTQLLLVTNKNLKACKIGKPIHYFELCGLSGVEREQALNDVKSILMEFMPEFTPNEIHTLVYFMHEHHWNDSIKECLEAMLRKDIFNPKQKEFLLFKLEEYGYKPESCTLECAEEKVEKSSVINFIFRCFRKLKKLVKYCLPYGIVRIYQRRINKDK